MARIVRIQCTVCEKNRALRFFPIDGRTKTHSSVCATCRKKKTSASSHATRVQATYGITGEEYRELFDAQGGVCAICKGARPYRLDVDHSHALQALGLPARETVRGLCCKNCNRKVLRSAKDNADLLRAAADYLDDPPARKLLKTPG